MMFINVLANKVYFEFKINLIHIILKSHTPTHIRTKYLHIWKFYKCNNYKYIKQNNFEEPLLFH